MLRETLSLSDADLRGAALRTELAVEPDLPRIPASPDHLKQVFLNLVINAVEAMPEGGCLSIAAQRDGPRLAISFADQGVGIRPEHRGKIFDAFFTTKGAVSGVGLGLSVSWGIVREHGGTIEVADAPGGGAVFTVFLPIAPAATDGGSEGAEATARTAPHTVEEA